MGLGDRQREAGAGSRWGAGVLVLAAVVCAVAGFVVNRTAGAPAKVSTLAGFERHAAGFGHDAVVFLLWAVAVLLVLSAITVSNRAQRAGQPDRGQTEAQRLAVEQAGMAGRLAGQLLAGEPTIAGQVWDVVLMAGERALLDGRAGYSRYYGIGPAATHGRAAGRYRAGAVSGHRPPGETAARTDGRGRARGPAAAAAARWREHQQARVLVTDRRLLCQLTVEGWVSFPHAEATAIRVVPDTRSVVLEYPDVAAVCLSGPVSTQIAVVIVWALYGADGLREHPALAEVRALAPFAEVSVTEASGWSGAGTRAAPAPATAGTGAGQQPDRDRSGDGGVDLLTFVAGRELVLAEGAARLLGVSEQDAAARLEAMVEQGLVFRVRLSAATPTGYRVTPHGADQLHDSITAPGALDLAAYANAVTATER